MSQFKRDNIEDLWDILDSLNDPTALRIFNKLSSKDLLDLKYAVQEAIKDAVKTATYQERSKDEDD